MYVSHPLKLVWVRVPKTGSTSFYLAFDPVADWKPVGGDDHQYLDLNKAPEGYRTVLTIRNPFDWVQSFCLMCMRAPAHWREYVTEDKNCQERKLDTFFKKFCLSPMRWGEVDEVWRIEDLAKLCKQHGVNPAGRHNVSSKEDRENNFEWTQERIDWAQKLFARELEYYGSGDIPLPQKISEKTQHKTRPK